MPPAVPAYVADGLPVVILELLPPARLIILGGKDRPERGFGITSRQRATKTHYPGSGAASVQVLGTEHDPIVLAGWFHDPLSVVDGGAASRIAMLRGLLQSQSRCSLKWGDAIHRFGRVSRVDFRFHTANRVRYEVEFDVDEAWELVAATPLPIVPGSVADFAAAARAALSKVSAAVEVVGAVKTIGGVVT